MFTCPQCSVELDKFKGEPGVYWHCPRCRGRSATVSLLRRIVRRKAVNAMWQKALRGEGPRRRACPSCRNPMHQVLVAGAEQSMPIDVCPTCQFLWLDPGELAALPQLPPERTEPEVTLPQKAREALAVVEVDQIRERARGQAWGSESPDSWWKFLMGVFGMPVEHEVNAVESVPIVTWLLAFVVTAVSIFAFTDLRAAVSEYGFIPSQPWRLGGLTFFTSFFLHGGIMHLVGNMYFFLVFGDNVEDVLGKAKFLTLIIVATLAGGLAHMLGDPRSMVPCIGASGGISGVIAYYALRFPHARLGICFRIVILFKWLYMPAYAMFILWVAMQFLGMYLQLAGFSNVSALAHLGGAAVGIIFWAVTNDV